MMRIRRENRGTGRAFKLTAGHSYWTQLFPNDYRLFRKHSRF
jgi:hypothetical protein